MLRCITMLLWVYYCGVSCSFTNTVNKNYNKVDMLCYIVFIGLINQSIANLWVLVGEVLPLDR